MVMNRDTIIAIVLLLVCTVMFINTTQMPAPMFGQMPATLWPRMILVPLALLSVLLLIRAQKFGDLDAPPARTFSAWLAYYKSPLVCFALFFLFLITMPVLGMLLGGLAYVFVTLCFLGGWSPRKLMLHGVVTLVCVVGMWAIFTQLLGVFLPEGVLLRVY